MKPHAYLPANPPIEATCVYWDDEAHKVFIDPAPILAWRIEPFPTGPNDRDLEEHITPVMAGLGGCPSNLKLVLIKLPSGPLHCVLYGQTFDSLESALAALRHSMAPEAVQAA